MKRIIYLLILITGLFSCRYELDTTDCPPRLSGDVELSEDYVVVDSKAQTVTITTNHNVWHLSDEIDVNGTTFGVYDLGFEVSYDNDEFTGEHDSKVTINYEWFTIVSEFKKIRVDLLENNEPKSRTIRIYVIVYPKTIYEIDIVQGAKQ